MSEETKSQRDRIQDQIDEIKKNLVEKTRVLKTWGTLADLYTARDRLPTEMMSEGSTASNEDSIDASMAEYLAGYKEYQDGNFTDAEGHFLNSIDLLDWNILAIVNLGNLQYLQGGHDKAEETFNKALTYAENDARSEILTNLGMNALKRDLVTDAKEFFHQAIDINSSNASALNDMGLVKEAEENDGEALEYYKRAIKADPSDEEIWYNLGTLLGKQGNKEGRLFCFIKAEKRGFIELKEMIDDLYKQGIEPVNPLA
ncbi:MAG TPA: tetratricopeptide repeat protein [Candidatus Lokiarchaeia archaeon]|nr:tetratricopeptide repeat protein [Candidatus Lokiarchaeia archaeon]